jgi:outer membrane protein assembly factor BamE
VLFDGDKLVSINAPELPGEREFVESIDTFKTSRNAPPLALTEEQLKALPVPPKPPEPAASAPEGPVRAYPPLERS